MNTPEERPDLGTPPDPRPAPHRLLERIEADLDRTGGGQRRAVRVVAPIAAASLLAAGVFGAFQISDSASAPAPADSPASSPTAANSSAPTPAPTPDDVTEDVRPMTEAEISKDLGACEADLDAPEGEEQPHEGEWEVRYAMVRDQAPHGESTHLILSDEVGMMSCVDGENYGWTRHYEATDRTPSQGRSGAQTVLPNADTSSCDPEGSSPDDALISHRMFAVTENVANVRARFVVDGVENPWTTTAPDHGHAVVRATATGDETQGEKAIVEVQLLDADGEALETDYYDGGDSERHLKTGTTASTEEPTCTKQPKGPFGPHGETYENPPAELPADDEAGVADCRDQLFDAYDDEVERDYAAWQEVTVVSTDDAWGAVLHDGNDLIGCSRYPSVEVGNPASDRPSTDKDSFHFALQTAPDDRETLWAAGRVPDDVTAITYALPNGDEAEAVITDGYWMVMYSNDEPLGTGDPTTWDPLRVSVTSTTETLTHEIEFTPETMCNQASHGC